MTAEQEIILKILIEIRRICDNHNLKYFLAYGTLLGAVRHKGFIPWDDDIDIVMFRDEYEEFLRIAEKELPEYYKLRKPGVKDYPFYFAKVDDARTTKIEQSTIKSKYKSGCWVDIFPIDGRPKNKNARKIYDFNFILKWFMCCIKTRNLSDDVETSKIKKYLYEHSKTKDIGKLIARFEKYCKKYSVNSSDYVSLDEVRHIRSIERKYYEEQSEYEFEGEKFTSVKDYDGYLRFVFNDYMKLPKEEDRQQHSILYLDLDKSYFEYKFDDEKKDS